MALTSLFTAKVTSVMDHLKDHLPAELRIKPTMLASKVRTATTRISARSPEGKI